MRLRHTQHDAPGSLIRCLRLQSRIGENQIPYGRRRSGKVEEQTHLPWEKNFKMEERKTKYRCLVFSFVEYIKTEKKKEVVTFYITDDKTKPLARTPEDMYLRF